MGITVQKKIRLKDFENWKKRLVLHAEDLFFQTDISSMCINYAATRLHRTEKTVELFLFVDHDSRVFRGFDIGF